MAVRLRLTRIGTNKKARYRVVAAEGRWPRDGRFLEILGTYDPQANPARVSFQEERVLEWLRQGATPTETVESLLKKAGIWKKFAEARRAPAQEG
ncbi:MAG: 30S ribosomal protein S16 [Deltaproteobacteria bacterium]|nr:30S ribosomal protein S16 [Deltaproteobacteria bacterium]MBI3079580.1 30S ribosomal protein S16 [Deltaproteobacteria bacterium]